ncbi:hypothetical protein [Nonomuraea sp. CA-141351]|uniref:hypothetical protein n=1 Tax=Nonomuraea sp. CA-141351 TaxID=3239996 RepID=UPI003D8A625B
MSYRKLTRAVLGGALALLLIPATTTTAQTTTAATRATMSEAASASAGVAQAVERESIKCIRPSGKRTNYSWEDGNTSTTVYFNNHCTHRVYATLHFKGPLGTEKKCLATNGGTSGKKKFGKGVAVNLAKITKNCF